MTREGIDFSWARPGGAAIAAAGKTFVVRYLPYHFHSDVNGANYDDGGKGLTKAEIADYRAHGLDIVANFETASERMKLGKTAGVEDAKQARTALSALGLPSDMVVYFSADWNTVTADYDEIDGYLRGAASVLGADRIGIYGEYDLLAHCRSAGTARYFWQTLAWSGGKVASFAHLYQYATGSTGAPKINGGAVDDDRALQAEFGQWKAERMGLNINLDATHDTSPLDAFGTAKIVGTGHYSIRVSDGAATPIADGTSLGVVQKGVVVDAFGSSFAAGEACVVYNLSGELHASPVRDIGTTFKALAAPADSTPFSQADVDKAVTDATTTLQATIADLKTQLAGANLELGKWTAFRTSMRERLGV